MEEIREISKFFALRSPPCRILFAAGDLGKGFTYDMAAILADRIVSLDEKFDNVVIVFNRFNSVVSYTVTEINMDTFMHLQNRPEFNVYGFEENAKLDHLQDYFEFQLSSAIYNAVIESNASELGARMTAMDNASKNAKEMLRLLNISYNRGRQAAITTELSEVQSIMFITLNNFADYWWSFCC